MFAIRPASLGKELHQGYIVLVRFSKQCKIMADPDAAALTVRSLPVRRDDDGSFFIRQFVLERTDNTVQLEELRDPRARAHLQDLLALQLYFTIKMKFQLERIIPGPDPFGDGNVAPLHESYLLKPSAWVVEPDADPARRLDTIIEVARDKLAEHLERARLNGSRDNIGGLLRIYVLTSPGRVMANLPPAPAVGDEAVGKHLPLPPLLARKKCFWNPQTTDGSCFAWCIRGSLLEVEKMGCEGRKSLARLTDKRFFEEGCAPVQGKPKSLQRVVPRNFGYNFSTLPDPSAGATWQDIQDFERANGFRLCIFVWEWLPVEWEGKTYYERHLVREPLVQDFPPEKEINLLKYSNHYCLIWNFKAFFSERGVEMDGSRQTSHHTKHVCHRCHQNFSSASVLAKHQTSPCSREPSKRVCEIRMPRSFREAEDENKPREDLIRYKCGPSEEFAPLTAYMDLEVESEPAPSERVAEHTLSLQKNVLSGCFLAVGRNGYEPYTRSYLTVREAGEGKFAAVERLMTVLRRESERYLLWKSRVNIPARLSAEEQREFDQATRCSTCNCRFEPDHPHRMKVCHHRHGTGVYVSPVCKRCNSLIVQPRLVRVAMHNGGSYDFRYLIRAIAAMRRQSWEEARAARAEPTEEEEAFFEEPEVETTEEGEENFFEEPEGELQVDEDHSSDITSEDVETAMQKKKWHELPFTVLYKGGEKLLSFRIGCLQFVDSMNFYKASLGNLIDELRKSSPQDPSRVFVQMSELHPELQPSALTQQRRNKLHEYFAPARSVESISDDEYKQWTWKLLLRKLPMPFEKMQGSEIWDKPAVWEVDDYRSSLHPESQDELEKKVKELRETCEVLCFESFRQVHDAYLFMDLSLSDVMEQFRTSFHSRFGLDPLQKISLPGAAYEAMLRGCLSHRSIQLVTDFEIYRQLRDGMMGGLSCIFNPQRRANSPELGDYYNASQPTSFITSMDVSSMYPTVMCEPMPVDGGVKIDLPPGHGERLKWLSETLDRIDFDGCEVTASFCFVVDYSFPFEFHDKLDWAPPCRMQVAHDQLSDYTQEILRRNSLQCSKVGKLVPYLGYHVKEAVDGKRLAFMCRVMGAKIEKLHHATRFTCAPFLKSWLEQCYQTRLDLKAKGFSQEAEVIKLVMNSMYGKLIQRCENNVTTKICTDAKNWIRASNNHRVQDLDVFSQDGEFVGVIHNVCNRPVVQQSMVQIGFRVLELSKLMLTKIHYLGVKRLYPQAVPLSTDTDSITYYIETNRDPLHAFAEANEAGDFPCFSDLAKDLVGKPEHSWILEHLTPHQQALAWKRAGELGGFGVEYLPVRIVEQIGLRAKLYSTLFATPYKGKVSKQRAKGVMKKVMPGHCEFKETLLDGMEKSVEYVQMSSRQYMMALERKQKKALSPFNDKIYQLDQFSGRPLGHWRNNPFLVQLVTAMGGPDSYVLKLILSFLR